MLQKEQLYIELKTNYNTSIYVCMVINFVSVKFNNIILYDYILAADNVILFDAPHPFPLVQSIHFIFTACIYI